MLKYLVLLSIFVLTFNLVNAETTTLSENFLAEMARKGSPRLDEIEAAFLNAQVGEGEVKEEFTPEFFGRASYAETNEQALINIQPVFSPIAQGQMGVRQNFRHGISMSGGVFTDQRTSVSSPVAGKFRDVTTTVLSFTVQLDIWKNLFGRLSKARLEYAEWQSKNANLQKEIQDKVYEISLRRIYWSLVANQESQKISEELLKTAQQQAQEARLRYKNAVADADEVARYEAQVSSRKSSILFLRYRRETFLKQLRILLPELGVSDIKLDNYDIDRTMDEVLACTAQIAMQPNVPYGNTKYDEMVSMLRLMRENKKTQNAHYADADVKLFGTIKSTGVASVPSGSQVYRGSFGDSIEDMTSNDRGGYEAGVLLTVPLGSTRDNVQRTKEIYDEKRLQASINNTDAQIIYTHDEVVKSIGLLVEVIKSQQENSGHLEKRLIGMKKKYQQARVSVNDLIMDQDSLFTAELTIIDSQLQMLNTLFDYFVVFTDTPCAFNRNKL